MKKILTLIVLLSSQVIALGQSLKLTVDRTSCYPKQIVECYLTLKGVDLSPPVEEIEGYSSTGMLAFGELARKDFHVGFPLTVGDVGEFAIGPYSININGQLITSNKVIITVKERPLGSKTISVTKSKVAVGETIQLTISSTDNDVEQIELPTLPLFEMGKKGFSTSSVSKNGKMEMNYTRTFWITATQKGKVTIEPSAFQNLEGELNSLTITVRSRNIIDEFNDLVGDK